MKLITIILGLLISGVTYAGNHENSATAQNVKKATQFMKNVLTDPNVAKGLLHDDLDFEFMGVSQLANVMYD